ncbi:MAG: 50S ribosomal protein L24 [Clostridiales bacterium]|nr:50S ribosomal protein L24 [Candidatus Apopatousia equi]
MNNMSVKKGDTVVVISGKDSGKVAKVNAVDPKSNRVIVADVNVVSRHTKARSAQEKSQIVKREAPIDASNVLVVCPKCGKATRVAHAVVDGKKVRTCKKCGASLDSKYVKPKKEAKQSKKAEEKVEEKVVEKVEAKAEKPAAKKPATKKSAPKKEAVKTVDAKKKVVKSSASKKV